MADSFKIDEARIVFVAAIKVETAVCVMIAARAQKGEEIVEGIIFILIKCAFGWIEEAEDSTEEELIQIQKEAEEDEPWKMQSQKSRKSFR